MTTYFLICLLLNPNIGTINAQTPTSWQARGTGGGGSWFAASINPQNDQEFYIACDMSNLFNTTNFGQSYNMVHFLDVQANKISEVQFTNNSLIRYVLAVDAASGGGYPRKTIDGGNSWTAPITDPTGIGAFHLLANPNNANQVIITDYSNLYFSNDGGANFTLKYTTNQGSGIHIGGAFWDGNNIYIGSVLGIITSNNGGNTFTLSTPTGFGAGEVLLSFAAAKQGTITKFWALTANAGDVYAGVVPYDFINDVSKIYTLKAGQSTWTPKSTGVQATDRLYFIRCATNDTSIAYVGGSNDMPIVLKTNNGGTAWAHVFLTNTNQNIATGSCGQNGDFSWWWGELIMGMAVAPSNANKVVIGDYGFIHTTTNGGTAWQQAYALPADQHPAGANTPTGSNYHSVGIENTTAWQVFWIDSTNMWACYSDIKGNRSTDAGSSWSFNYTGQTYNSSYRVAKNISDNTLYMATSSVHDLYESTRLGSSLDAASNTGEVLYSTNNGATWQTLHNFSDIVAWVATNPNNANQLYASVVNSTNGNGGIWVSNNINLGGSSTWTKLSNPPRTEGHPFNIIVLNNGNVLCSYSGHRNPGFTASSGVFLYNPNTNTWQDKSDLGMYYWTRDVIVDPFDATQNTWYACVYSGWGGAPNGLGGLYKTTNSGTTWNKINTLDRVGSVTINPNNTNEMYLCTETEGLWFCANRNVTSPVFEQVNSYPFRQPERVFFNPYDSKQIWVANFGNSLRIGSTACTPPTPIITGSLATCANGTYTYSVTAIAGATYTWTVTGGTIQTGQSTNQISVLWNNGTVGSVQIEQTNP